MQSSICDNVRLEAAGAVQGERYVGEMKYSYSLLSSLSPALFPLYFDLAGLKE